MAQARTQAVLDKLAVLSNCANKSLYEYEDKEIRIIFNAIEKETKRVRTKFEEQSSTKFSLR